MGRRARREYETLDFLKACRRMLAAAGRRCADADEVELAELLTLADELQAATQAAVDGMRARGCSWSYIAMALGTTKQGAQQRFGRKVAA